MFDDLNRAVRVAARRARRLGSRYAAVYRVAAGYAPTVLGARTERDAYDEAFAIDAPGTHLVRVVRV